MCHQGTIMSFDDPCLTLTSLIENVSVICQRTLEISGFAKAL